MRDNTAYVICLPGRHLPDARSGHTPDGGGVRPDGRHRTDTRRDRSTSDTRELHHRTRKARTVRFQVILPDALVASAHPTSRSHMCPAPQKTGTSAGCLARLPLRNTLHASSGLPHSTRNPAPAPRRPPRPRHAVSRAPPAPYTSHTSYTSYTSCHRSRQVRPGRGEGGWRTPPGSGRRRRPASRRGRAHASPTKASRRAHTHIGDKSSSEPPPGAAGHRRVRLPHCEHSPARPADVSGSRRYLVPPPAAPPSHHSGHGIQPSYRLISPLSAYF